MNSKYECVRLIDQLLVPVLLCKTVYESRQILKLAISFHNKSENGTGSASLEWEEEGRGRGTISTDR